MKRTVQVRTWMTIDEVAKTLCVNRRTIERYITDPAPSFRLPSHTLGRKLRRVASDDLDRWCRRGAR